MTREEILQQISTDPAQAVQLYQNSDLGLGVLRELANDLETPGVDVFLASMPGTPSRVLDILIQRNNPEVIRLLAQNPALHTKLAAHPDAMVRQLIAENRRLTPAIAMQLAKDAEASVRVALAKNPIIPTNIQRILLQDPVPFVRLALLENRRLEAEFMDGLSDDLNPTVHACTLLTPRLSPLCMKSWAEFDEELGQLVLSKRGDLPPPVVTKLSQSKYPSVRLSLLRHQALPDELLAPYLDSEDPEVLRILANRESLSPDTQHALLANPAFPPDARLALAQRTDLADAVGVELCETPTPELLQHLALNLTPELPAT
ncbi:MAG: hypothetical protein IKR13_02205, partial [Victivallales bacterium]|nr:hypothetical protein [Victivallales bacterium]